MSITDKQFNFVSQNAHMLAGYGVVLTFGFIFGISHMIWYTSISVVVAGVKEFWYDQHYETKEVRGSNLDDFKHYCIGIAVAIIIILIRSGHYGCAK